jgi:hypothetical protein
VTPATAPAGASRDLLTGGGKGTGGGDGLGWLRNLIRGIFRF